nr:TonB-dependent receptor [Sphingobium lactosutens]
MPTALAPCSAIAQSTAPPQQAVKAAGIVQDSASVGIQDIVVTAQRRSERLQDVPITINAFSAADRERFAITEAQNLQFVTPGLTFPNNDATINPYIRGRGTAYSGQGLEGSVAVYVDDIYQQSQLGTGGLFDTAQIQVLKGPQGTLYGRNATGGAILINTSDPDFKNSGSILLGYGNFHMLRAEGFLNIAASDNLAVRIAGATDKNDGFLTNIVYSERGGRARNYAARVKALWEPGNGFSILAKGEIQQRNIAYIRQLSHDASGAPTGLSFYETFQSPQRRNFLKVRAWQMAATAKYEGDSFSITNNFSYKKMQNPTCVDNDFTPGEVFVYCDETRFLGRDIIPNTFPGAPQNTDAGSYDKTFIDELRAATSFDGPLNFIAGTNYQRSKARLTGVLGGSLFAGIFPVFDNYVNTTSYSFYGEGTYHATEQLKITFGGRYSKDSKVQKVFDNADVGFIIPTPLPANGAYRQSGSWDNFTPRLVVAYDSGPSNFYVSYSKGFKAGGFNSPVSVIQPALRPETIRGFEAGTKLRLLDNRVRFDLAAFHTKASDIQVARVEVKTGSGGVVQENAGGVKAWGVEANIDIVASDRLRLQGGMAYLHSRYSRYENASVVNLVGGVLQLASADLSGTRTPNSPDWTANGSATYNFPIASDWQGDVTLLGRYSSSYDFAPGGGGNLHFDRQAAFTIFNLTGRVRSQTSGITLSWYVSNLFDKKYYDQVTTNGGVGVVAQPALPRTYGGAVKYDF